MSALGRVLGKRWLRKALMFPILGYTGVVIGMLWLENRLVFRGETAAENWQDSTLAGLEDVTFSTPAGTRIHAWYLPALQGNDALLLCHGNGGNISYRESSLERFQEHLNCSVLIFDYPGYGKSEGKPTEANCYASADAAFQWLIEQKRIPANRIILYGESLGGGVAVELALHHEHRALALAKTFTSLPAVAQRMYRWLPVRWLMRNRFDNLSKIADCHRPVLIANGTRDTLIPFEQGEELFRAANEPKFFLPLEDQTHGDRLPDEFMLSLRNFLQESAP